MIFYSHSRLNIDGVAEGSKLLTIHTTGVYQAGMHHFYEKIELKTGQIKLLDLFADIVLFHDLGKYTPYFQDYLLGRTPVDGVLKRHAKFGAYAAFNYWWEREEKKLAVIALLLIFRHHGYLISLDELLQKIKDETGDYENNFTVRLASIQPFFGQIKEEINRPDLEDYLKYPKVRAIRRFVNNWLANDTDIQDYFLVNYLFSLLIEGDKLDASDTKVYQRVNIDSLAVDKRFGLPVKKGVNLWAVNQNELRNYCRAEVIGHLNDGAILEHFLFTLTAPTGIGKTMIALDFALKLRTKIKEVEQREAQIIYALPFINIIEQALAEYEKTLPPEEVRILAHYQFADVFSIPDDSDEKAYHKKAMTLDTWQGDIIITSFVQFFETLISNRNKLLKKFNHLAGSIVILDEIQTLALQKLPLIGAVLYYLSKFLRTRIVLMTATKPKIFELASTEILAIEKETVVVKELLSSYEAVFKVFNRTAIYPMLSQLNGTSEEKNDQFVEEILVKVWEPGKSCLIVCNTVKRSIALYNKIQSYLADNDFDNPLYYLSTNILPIVRLGRINQIKQDLKDNNAPMLIATQVVEAGVDLDFDMGIRDLGPVDSMVQVAGRINRENSANKANSPLYIVDFEDATIVYDKTTAIQAQKAIKDKKVIYEKDYLELINAYFEGISGSIAFQKSRAFFKSLKTLNYDCEDREQCPVSAFRMIEQSGNYHSVFVELNESSCILRKQFFNMITKKIDKEEYEKLYKRSFQQHIVSVPNQYTASLEPINEYVDDILYVPYALLSSFYNKTTGFIRDTTSSITYVI